MDDSNLDNERELQWRMVFEDNDGEVDDTKALIYAKRWDIYVNEKEKIVKGGYLVEVFVHDSKKVLWEAVDNHVVEEATNHDEIGLRGFGFNFLTKMRRG